MGVMVQNRKDGGTHWGSMITSQEMCHELRSDRLQYKSKVDGALDAKVL